jgi:hypothetical protein
MIELNEINDLGHDLQRPECVLCTSNGRVFVTNVKGGITVIEPDGQQSNLIAKNPGFDLAPNSFCLVPDGSVLLANLGAVDGGVHRLNRNGDCKPFVIEADGQVLPPTNYVHRDSLGRVWITVSTRKMPRALGYRKDVKDGFIVLADNRGARVVADGLGYTNECVVHPDSKRLYVNETFGRRLSSFDIGENGDLSNRLTVAEFGHGTFPDGLTFDADGGVWITSIVSNRVIRVSPDGRSQRIVIEDCDAAHVDAVETAFQSDMMTKNHLATSTSKRLGNISSLAFGGARLDKIHLGCLLDDRIYTCPSPVRGHPPSHWHMDGPKLH